MLIGNVGVGRHKVCDTLTNKSHNHASMLKETHLCTHNNSAHMYLLHCASVAHLIKKNKPLLPALKLGMNSTFLILGRKVKWGKASWASIFEEFDINWTQWTCDDEGYMFTWPESLPINQNHTPEALPIHELGVWRKLQYTVPRIYKWLLFMYEEDSKLDILSVFKVKKIIGWVLVTRLRNYCKCQCLSLYSIQCNTVLEIFN